MSARIAILTSQPVVDGVPLYQVAPNVEVREWRPNSNAPWGAWEPTEKSLNGWTDVLWEHYQTTPGLAGMTRTRTVPVSLPPSPTMPCDICDGSGEWSRDGGREVVPCERCNGTRTVPAPWLIAIEQCRHPRWAEWDDYYSYRHAGGAVPGALGRTMECLTLHERRQVVVAESPAPDVLPVVDQDDPMACLDFGDDRTHLLLHDEAAGELQDVTGEPWATNLRPGMTVWRFTPTLLDTPIVETANRCPCDGSDGITHEPAVPLSLIEGVPTIIEVP